MIDIKMLDEVKEGIQKYIGFFQTMHGRMADASKPSYHKLIEYWKDVLHVLNNEKIQYRAEDGDNWYMVFGLFQNGEIMFLHNIKMWLVS